MAEEKATVLLSQDVWKRIEWLTKNMTTEIAAVGKVEIKETEEKERYFYVSQLYFPKQKVTGASVKIDPEGWGDILRQVTLKGMKDLKFYWHRHPGSSSHSHTDEEDTFGTFASNVADRDYFIFLQTAESQGKFNHELRVELRTPIRATMMGTSVTQLKYEVPNQDEFNKEMKAIVEEAIIVEEPTPTNHTSMNQGWSKPSSACRYGQNLEIESELKALQLLFETGKQKSWYSNNESLYGVATNTDEQASIHAENGGITFKAGAYFNRVLEKALDKGGVLEPAVNKFTVDKPTEKGRLYTYKLQPHAKGYDELIEGSKNLYIAYNSQLILHWKKNNIITPKVQGPKTFSIKKAPKVIAELLKRLDKHTDVTWEDDKQLEASVFEEKDPDSKVQICMGKMTLSDKGDSIIFNGERLIKTITTYLETLKVGGK